MTKYRCLFLQLTDTAIINEIVSMVLIGHQHTVIHATEIIVIESIGTEIEIDDPINEGNL